MVYCRFHSSVHFHDLRHSKIFIPINPNKNLLSCSKEIGVIMMNGVNGSVQNMVSQVYKLTKNTLNCEMGTELTSISLNKNITVLQNETNQMWRVTEKRNLGYNK